MSNKNYTVYHLHTENSLLDSCTNYKLYVDKAVELGQTAIAFSEHGNTYNWIEKKMYANEKGLKYIHACEMYLTASLDEKVRDNYHTILIAKNQDGVKELNTLIDLATQEDHFYYKPRITFTEFFSISNNIIKISACLASPLNRYPQSENASREVYERLFTDLQRGYGKAWLVRLRLCVCDRRCLCGPSFLRPCHHQPCAGKSRLQRWHHLTAGLEESQVH